MKTGMEVQEFATELQRQTQSKIDYLASTKKLNMYQQGNDVRFSIDSPDPISLTFKIGKNAHQQLAARLNIDSKYYNRCLTEAPELLARNVNHWFYNKPEARLVRTLDGNVRAYLSNRYQPIDNYDLLNVILPVASSYGATIKSCNVSEDYMHVKMILEELEGEVKVGDVIRAGIYIRNSEVGRGKWQIQPFNERLSCTNGMIRTENVIGGVHLGGRNFLGGNDSMRIFSDQTNRLTDQAMLSQLKDALGHVFSRVQFEKSLDPLREAVGIKLDAGKQTETVEIVSDKFGTTQDENQSILRHLAEGGDFSQWGIANAVTRAASDVEDYDRATELEAVGGKLIEVKADFWRDVINN